MAYSETIDEPFGAREAAQTRAAVIVRRQLLVRSIINLLPQLAAFDHTWNLAGVNRFVNDRFEVDDGLNSLSFTELEELREHLLEKLTTNLQGITQMNQTTSTTNAPVADIGADRKAFSTEPQRPANDIIRDLHKPIHPKHLQTRRQGGKELTYIAWYDACKYLDLYAPGWCYEIRKLESIGGKVVMIVRITIPTQEGGIYREATGFESEDKDSFGDAFSNAESMALRRAAAKLGLGQHLYRDK